MKSRKKKERAVRTRDWSVKYDDAFSHDRARHLKAVGAVPAPTTPFVQPENVQPNALVISHSGRWAFVLMSGQERLCVIDERLGEGISTVLAPGDDVYVESQEGAQQAVVRAIMPRRTKLSRLAHVHSRLSEQVIAANIDLLVIVASASRPVFKPGLVDRYMIVAEAGGVTPLLVINKMDLVDVEPCDVAQYRELGLAVVNTSCIDGVGIGALREALRGRLSVVAGHSGVGKSSLLNAIDPSLSIATQEVSRSTDKGRHTTTGAKLYVLGDDTRIVDTPGARNLGIWGVSPEEVAYYFPEMAEIAVGCRFRDCTHIHEPHCAVRAAVESGTMLAQRYGSYCRIRASLEQ
jgi:ribosome biogenesis GTPase / thiamine phosphate phosphatase